MAIEIELVGSHRVLRDHDLLRGMVYALTIAGQARWTGIAFSSGEAIVRLGCPASTPEEVIAELRLLLLEGGEVAERPNWQPIPLPPADAWAALAAVTQQQEQALVSVLDGLYYVDDRWTELATGSWRYSNGTVSGTVYRREGVWRALITGDGHSWYLKEASTDLKAVREQVADAIDFENWSGSGDWSRISTPTWKTAKAGHRYLRAGSTVYSVKQAQSGSYFVTTPSGLWTSPSGATWFRTETAAISAVNEALGRCA